MYEHLLSYTACKESKAIFNKKYHSGVWLLRERRYSCCDCINKQGPGCKTVSFGTDGPPTVVGEWQTFFLLEAICTLSYKWCKCYVLQYETEAETVSTACISLKPGWGCTKSQWKSVVLMVSGTMSISNVKMCQSLKSSTFLVAKPRYALHNVCCKSFVSAT